MAGRPVVLVPGNHDHRLAEPLLEQLALAGEPLGLEHARRPGRRAATRIAAWLGDAELEIAYPGRWLRDDVYATHGHYMDCHMSLPRLECIAAAASMRALKALPERTRPADYERVLRPVYGLTYGLAQGGVARSARPVRPSAPGEAISGRNGAGRVRRAAVRAAIPAGDLGRQPPPSRRLRPRPLRRVDLAQRHRRRDRDVGAAGPDRAADMITGHTHRAGPGDGDGVVADSQGGRLHNTGSWVFASAFHHPGTPPGPYWPGTRHLARGRGPAAARTPAARASPRRAEGGGAAPGRVGASEPLGDDPADLLAGVLLEEVAGVLDRPRRRKVRAARRPVRRPRRAGSGRSRPRAAASAARRRAARRRPVCPRRRRARRARSAGSAGRRGCPPSTPGSG